MNDLKQAKGVWKSRLQLLLEIKGNMLGKGRALRPEELAEAVGVSRQTVYAWMSDNGLQRLTADHAIRLQRYFGVPVDKIWQLEDQEEDQGVPVPVAV